MWPMKRKRLPVEAANLPEASGLLPRWLARRVDRLEAHARRSYRLDLMLAGSVLGASVVSGIVAGGHVSTTLAQAAFLGEEGLVTAGLAVGEIRIEGISETDERDVLDYLGVTDTTAMPFVDPEAARERIVALPWVRSASVQKLYPSTLLVTLSEYEPFALWQRGERLAVIDRDGTVVTDNIPPRLAGLPRLYGIGADKAGAALMAALETVPQVRTRLEVAEYVSERRWTLHLENGLAVHLPENGLIEALHLLAQMEEREEIFSRSLVSIDLRLPDRVTVRLTDDGIQRRDAALRDRAGVVTPRTGGRT